MSTHPTHSHQHDESGCDVVLAHLDDYLDHTLAPELCAALEAHLAECENCRVVYDTLNQTLYLVHQLRETPPELPEAVEYRLFAVMNLEQFLPKDKKR